VRSCRKSGAGRGGGDVELGGQEDETCSKRRSRTSVGGVEQHFVSSRPYVS